MTGREKVEKIVDEFMKRLSPQEFEEVTCITMYEIHGHCFISFEDHKIWKKLLPELIVTIHTARNNKEIYFTDWHIGEAYSLVIIDPV